MIYWNYKIEFWGDAGFSKNIKIVPSKKSRDTSNIFLPNFKKILMNGNFAFIIRNGYCLTKELSSNICIFES
jgi:hypothetical protein